MKSSENFAKFSFKRKPNFYVAIVAVIIAFGMWVYVSRMEMRETEIEVNLDYTKIPADLVVTEGLINKVTVRLRGPEPLIRSLARERVTQPVELDKIKKGENILPLTTQTLGAKFRAFKIIDIEPTRIELLAEPLIDKTVPLRIEYDLPFRDDAVTIENNSQNISSIVLRGPESKLESFREITARVRPNLNDSKPQSEEITLDTPNFVTAIPPKITIKFLVTTPTKDIEYETRVKVAGDSGARYEITPDVFKTAVKVPESLSGNAKYLSQFTATVVPPPMRLDETLTVPVNFNVPEGMQIREYPFREVTLKKIKD